MQLICFSELLKTTNIQKPPVYKHVLPRVLETMTNNGYSNNRDKNIATKPSPSLSAQLPFVYESPTNTSRERQSRVDRILEKYRRQPSSSISRQFSRSFSCNAATDSALSTESNLPLNVARSATSDEDSKQSSSGPRSVSPYSLFDRSDHTTRRENKFNATADSLLLKSYSLKTLGEYRIRSSTVDNGSITKSNGTFINNNEDDPPSWSSSSSTATTTTSKSMAPKEDANHNYYYPALMDWTVGNCSEETVSDRIKRRSYYVKLK